MDVTHRSTPVQCNDQWAFRPLGVCARRGYDTYGGVPMWPRAERALAFQGDFHSLNQFSNAIFSKF
jgi:hypothetical protein